MDYGSGWLVSQSGSWIPVAYNASVSVDSPFRRASFTSLDGVRSVASRGRGPRTWSVEEDVFVDWAQALENLYHSATADLPLYWVPPLAAMSNYGMLIDRGYPGQLSPLSIGADSSGKTHLFQTATAIPGIRVTDFFPLKPNTVHKFGARLSRGRVALVGYDFNGKPYGDLAVTGYTKSTASMVGTYNGNKPGVHYGSLMIDKDAVNVSNPFIALGDHVGVDHTGSGGCWVTIDDLEVSHDSLNQYNPLVKVKFELTECKGR